MTKISRARATESMKSPARRTRGIGATVAMVLASAAVALAGCGSSSSSTSSDSSGAGSGATPASSQTASSTKLAQFSQCMRAHGLADFPDPVNGRIPLRVTRGSDLNPRSAGFQSALKACKSLEPAGFAGNGSPSPQTQAAQLKFVSCMRSHGVPKFPDPQPNGGMIITSGSGVDPNSPAFQSAVKTCRKFLPGGGTGAVGR